MKTKRMMVKKVSCIAAMAILWAGCGSNGFTQKTNSLDEDGDGVCDLCDNQNFLPPEPTEMFPVPEHSELRLEISVAEGIGSPTNGRMALLAYDYHADSEVHELFTAELPSILPSVVNFHLGVFPQELIDEVVNSYLSYGAAGIKPPTYEEIGVQVSCVLAIYDDINQNGRMDLGDQYPATPAMDASNEEWNRHFEELEAWDQKYGHLDFVGLSSPSDPNNEVLSLTPVSISYVENVPDLVTSERKVGYALSLEETSCLTNRRDLQGGGYEECNCCWSELTPLDPDEVQPIMVSWQLPVSNQ